MLSNSRIGIHEPVNDLWEDLIVYRCDLQMLDEKLALFIQEGEEGKGSAGVT